MIYRVYSREENRYIEFESNKSLNFFYENFFGRLLLKVLNKSFITKLGGAYMESSLSKRKIEKFINKNEINMDDYEKEKYKNFNEFFIRKIKPEKRKINMDKNVFISPADAKLNVYRIKNDLVFDIKNVKYTINELLNKEVGVEYKNGYLMIFRLEPTDYHRYCFVDNGTIQEKTKIKGVFHTVQPISNKDKPFCTNSRETSVLNTENFGELVYIEVGALMVGKIVNHEIVDFSKGEEKGYFKFGGSTVCILVKDVIEIDEDIRKNSEEGIETIVKFGEKIAIKKETN